MSENIIAQVAISANNWEYCELCRSVEDINWKCINCEYVLCNSCQFKHRRGRKTASDVIINKTERHQEEKYRSSMRCDTHNTEDVSLYCATCNVLVCPECMVFKNKKHYKHEFEAISEAATNIRHRLERKIEMKKKAGTVSIETLNREVLMLRKNDKAEISRLNMITEKRCKLFEKAIRESVSDIKRNKLEYNKFITALQSKQEQFQEEIEKRIQTLDEKLSQITECLDILLIREEKMLIEDIDKNYDPTAMDIPEFCTTNLQNEMDLTFAKAMVSQTGKSILELSSFASKQVTEGNPNIADLSDKNRPSRLGEKFSELFYNEWVDAFETLRSVCKTDTEIVILLSEIVEEIYTFCQEMADIQLQRIGDQMEYAVTSLKIYRAGKDRRAERNPEDPTSLAASTRKTARLYRKETAMASVPALCLLFCDVEFREKYPKLSLPELPDSFSVYLNKCVEFIWLMCIQDPRMVLEWQRPGESVKTEMFKFYKNKGTKVKVTVWPVLYLHNGGPVFNKGYVLPS